MQEVPALQALLRFVRFGLPWDFGRTITIARGEARPVVHNSLAWPHSRDVKEPMRLEARLRRLASSRHAVAGRPSACGIRMRAASTQMDAAEPHRRSGRRAGRGARSGTAETSYADSPACPRAERPRRGQISNVGIRECRQYPGLKRTRASANTSGPDSTLARRPPVKLRSPYGEPHRTKKTCFFCRTGLWRANPRKRTIRPLT